MLWDFPSLDEPNPLITAYIRLPSLSASGSLFNTSIPIPSPSTVPSASFENGLASPVADSVWVLEKHMCMKMSFSVSTPPVTTISLRPDCNSSIDRCTALIALAQAASTTQLVPLKSRRLQIRPATTLPSKPGKEFSCHGMYESEIFWMTSSVLSGGMADSSRALRHLG